MDHQLTWGVLVHLLVDSGGVMTCNSQSYLVDGCSPDIDTCTCGWTFQLVTVRRNEGTVAVPIPHVLLTFGFDTAVSLTGIEMDPSTRNVIEMTSPTHAVQNSQKLTSNLIIYGKGKE